MKKDQFVFLQHILDSIDDIQNDSNYLGNVWKVVTDDIPVLRKKIEETSFTLKASEPVRVTASIGVSSFPRFPVTTPEELVKLTDLGVYQAKQTGRNRVCVAGSSFLKV